jgi:hypothetical protein
LSFVTYFSLSTTRKEGRKKKRKKAGTSDGTNKRVFQQGTDNDLIRSASGPRGRDLDVKGERNGDRGEPQAVMNVRLIS